MDTLLHSQGQGELRKKTSVSAPVRALRFALCLILLIIPVMSTAFSDNAIGQTVHPQRVEITRVIDGNGANPCPPFQGPGLPPAGECDQATVSKKITISLEL